VVDRVARPRIRFGDGSECSGAVACAVLAQLCPQPRCRVEWLRPRSEISAI